jgi:hypothetical protein
MKFDNLARPRPGERNTIVINGLRFANIISRKFLCPKCHVFCGELVPVLDGKVRKWMKDTGRTLSSPEVQVKVFCYSGCHLEESWGWIAFDWAKDVNRVLEWPAEWTSKSIQDAERKAREANDRYRGGER